MRGTGWGSEEVSREERTGRVGDGMRAKGKRGKQNEDGSEGLDVGQGVEQDMQSQFDSTRKKTT